MGQHEIEVILTQHLASYLAMPVFLVDPGGNLVFYNEPAEKILGVRFDETGSMPAAEWATAFQPTGLDGTALAPSELPLVIALTQHKPAHGSMRILGLDGIQREIQVTAFPLIGQGNRILGGVAMFWQVS